MKRWSRWIGGGLATMLAAYGFHVYVLLTTSTEEGSGGALRGEPAPLWLRVLCITFHKSYWKTDMYGIGLHRRCYACGCAWMA